MGIPRTTVVGLASGAGEIIMATVRTAVGLLALLGLVMASDSVVAAKKKPEMKSNQVRIEYVEPEDDDDLTALYQRMKERKVLEMFQDFLSPFKLPKPLWIKAMECDGESNAWYQAANTTVTICYEYIQELITRAPMEKAPDGTSRMDAIVGPTIEVVLHEVGHAIFHMLNIPSFGREEDSADQFAAYMMLHFDEDDARKAVWGVAFNYTNDAKEDMTEGMTNYASEHGLPLQRYYNLLCLAYGGFPTTFMKFMDPTVLPSARATRCAGEFRKVKHAMNKLIMPHIDEKLAAKVKMRQSWRRLAIE
jgi:hypothetical protein